MPRLSVTVSFELSVPCASLVNGIENAKFVEFSEEENTVDLIIFPFAAFVTR